MNLQARQRTLWTALCAVLLITAVASNQAVSRGATLELMPLPVSVPIPDEVFHSDNFGNAAAMDGATLVVGAPWTDVNGVVDQGVAYIYTRDPNDPTAFILLKSITGSDSAQHYSFGWSVDIHGDTLVVGTAESGSHTTFVGTVYIFERNQGGANNWGEVKKLMRDEATESLNYFGRTLALHGDTLVVGAALGLGKVSLFERNQDGENQWGKTQTLDGGIPITTTPRSASFGSVIVFDGETLAMLAPRAGLTSADLPPGSPAPPRNFESATFVYRQENGEWILDAKLMNLDIDLDNLDPHSVIFGTEPTLELYQGTLFVGNPEGTTAGVKAGKVYVYQRGAGTPPSVGQPGAWGEITMLSPSDGVEGDRFGHALYATDDALFVASQKQGIGKVYLFRNPSGQANSSAVLPQAPHAWSEVYGFSTSAGNTSTGFGLPLLGSGNSVIFGDHTSNKGRGGMVAYAKDALFVADPNATPIATPTDTPSPPPTAEPDLCGLTQETPSTQLFMPSVMGNAAASAIASLPAQPEAGPEIVSEMVSEMVGALVAATLAPGCMIAGPNGVKVAAVAGAISQTIAMTIETVAAPPEVLPEGATPTGEFLRISSATSRFVQMETPFVIALPVAANLDSAHLVLLHLSPATYTLDSKISGNVWGYIPGVYDPPSGLFLACMPFVLEEGVTFALAVHPDFDSPTNQPPTAPQTEAQLAAQPDAQSLRGEFDVFCIGFTFANPGDCTAAMEADAKAMLDEIYLRMTDPAGFGFPRLLRILDSGSQYIVSNTISATALTASYAAYIHGLNDTYCASGAGGYYDAATGRLVLCGSAGETLNADNKEELVHEFFHAVQFTYPEVIMDYLFDFEETWLIEGMATTAMRSYESSVMQRTAYFGLDNLQKVDQALTTGKYDDELVDEYLAQDFWVYVGASKGQDLSYLRDVLALGGATEVGADKALTFLFGKSLGEFYWDFVKNQTIENNFNVDEGPDDLCMFRPTSLKTATPVVFLAPEVLFPVDTKEIYDTVPPLTAKVIEIDPGGKQSLGVEIMYEGCMGLQDAEVRDACIADAQRSVKTKIYVEGEEKCHLETPPSADITANRFLSPEAGQRYFVVVANADSKNDHSYLIFID